MKPGGATVRIELRLRELAQLFNSMDPSPFVDRDIDPDAEEFIVSWARELPAERGLELVVHLATVPPADRAAGVEDAVQRYFASRAEIKRRDFRQLMRRGRVSLTVGLLFLAGSLLLANEIGRTSTTDNIVRTSLTIGGWVAMWRPLEIYLYDWWPLREEQRLMERLARMPVRLILPQS
jgi:hypothetical protein